MKGANFQDLVQSARVNLASDLEERGERSVTEVLAAFREHWERMPDRTTIEAIISDQQVPSGPFDPEVIKQVVMPPP